MYERILVATDGSELAGKGLREALKLAKTCGGRLDIVTVSEPWAIGMYDAMGWTVGYEATPEYRETREKLAQDILKPALATAKTAGVEAQGHHVPDHYAGEGILAQADALKSEVIVMASHGRRGVGKLLLGSQTQYVLTHGTIPVLVIR